MAHASKDTTKIRLLGLCPLCKERRLREERRLIEDMKGLISEKERPTPNKEEVRVFCPQMNCSFKEKKEIRKIHNT